MRWLINLLAAGFNRTFLVLKQTDNKPPELLGRKSFNRTFLVLKLILRSRGIRPTREVLIAPFWY